MDRNLDEKLYSTTLESLEQLYSLFPWPEPDGHTTNAPFEAATSVDYSGDLSGRMIIAVYGNIVSSMTATLCGEGETASDSHKMDTLGEMANVVCGNFLPYLAGPKAIYHIKSPKTLSFSDLESQKREEPITKVQIPLEQGRLELCLYGTKQEK